MRPTTAAINGMTTSPTSESTILPNAAPMMTPTARSMTLPFTANSRNSRSMPIAVPPRTGASMQDAPTGRLPACSGNRR
jgi:hypothetical protein